MVAAVGGDGNGGAVILVGFMLAFSVCDVHSTFHPL